MTLVPAREWQIQCAMPCHPIVHYYGMWLHDQLQDCHKRIPQLWSTVTKGRERIPTTTRLLCCARLHVLIYIMYQFHVSCLRPEVLHSPAFYVILRRYAALFVEIISAKQLHDTFGTCDAKDTIKNRSFRSWHHYGPKLAWCCRPWPCRLKAPGLDGGRGQVTIHACLHGRTHASAYHTCIVCLYSKMYSRTIRAHTGVYIVQ